MVSKWCCTSATVAVLLMTTACTSISKTKNPIQSSIAASATEDSNPRFVWPVDGGEITDSFGKKRRRGRVHKGLDIAGRRNTPVYAAEAGKVIWRGRGRGYGHYLVIRHENGWTTRYAHLNKYKVSWSQEVAKGQLIGLMGRTGRASGTHLHFEIRKDQMPLNPLAMLPKNQAKLADNYHGVPVSPETGIATARRETFRSAYLNGPVVWLF